MYLPAAELQQYKGFWVCPYCLMELRDEAKRMEKPPKKYPLRPIAYGEVCERCGREAAMFYIWNGRRLCKSCLDEEQKKWGLVGGGPAAAPYRIKYEGKKESFLASIVNKVLERVGLRKKRAETEIVVAPKQKVKVEKGKGKKSIVVFKYGKPLSEKLEEEKPEEKKEKPIPESEGLIRKTKKYPKRKKKRKKKK